MEFPRLGALIYLDRFQVEEVGFAPEPYVFQFVMTLPRPSVDDATRHIMVDDLSGEVVDWTDRALRERLIFKEIVEGPLSIGSSVFPAENSFLGELTDLVPNLGAEIVTEYFNQFGFRFSTVKDLFEVSQEGGVADFKRTLEQTFASGSENVTPREQTESTMRIPLVAPGAISNPSPDPTPSDRAPGQDDHEEILKESGESNGFVEFTIKLVER